MKNIMTSFCVAMSLIGGMVAPHVQAQANDEAPVDPAHAIAMAYGISGWDQVESIRFTFNVERADKGNVVRQWRWHPKTQQVELLGGGADVAALNFTTGAAAGETSEEVSKADGQFINDSYWFLFPYQLVWSNPSVTLAEKAEATPIGGGLALKATAQWPGEGGYTPGDAYDLYLDERGLIDQWVFRRGGGEEGNPSTWEGHSQLGPLVVSTEHRGPEGSNFRLFFTEVEATLSDGSTVKPLPLTEP